MELIVRLLILIAAIYFLNGCASQIMQSYIGKDLREVMLDHGSPTNAFDMGDGRRAFQWAKESSYTTPVTANTNGSVTSVGQSAWVNSNTTISGGQTVTSSCIYTLFATWNEATEGWEVVGFNKPDWTCE